ncbi:hypothetical protein M432DRAFT_640487 [Thermoascus aurantiacus ATCC 26904]
MAQPWMMRLCGLAMSLAAEDAVLGQLLTLHEDGLVRALRKPTVGTGATVKNRNECSTSKLGLYQHPPQLSADLREGPTGGVSRQVARALSISPSTMARSAH